MALTTTQQHLTANYYKRVSETLAINLDWTGVLADGDAVASATTTLSDDLNEVSTEVTDDNHTILYVSEGMADTTYEIQIRITTDEGETRVGILTLHVA